MAVGRREDSSVLPGGGENAETVRLPMDGSFRGVQQNLRELSLSCDSKEHSQERVAPRFCDLIMGALSQRAGRLAPAFLHTGFESGLLASLPISEHLVGTAEHAESSSVQIITCRVDCCLMNNPPACISTLALTHDAELLLPVLSFSYLCSLVFLTSNKFSSFSFLICSLTFSSFFFCL